MIEMTKTITISLMLLMLAFGSGVYAQDQPTTDMSSLNGTWVTQSGNLVEVTVNGSNSRLYFPDYALTRDSTVVGGTLIYTTHYNDTTKEEVYLSVPESERSSCTGFVHNGDERHRFTLTLSEDGMVLSGIKEINVMICEYDTDENGVTSNHRPVGFQWTYFSDYQWRRTDCDFSNLPPLDGSVLEKYDLVGIMLDRYGLVSEFSLGDFTARDRIKFVYDQGYIDSDTGVPVSASEKAEHQHVEPMDGRVYFDEAAGIYKIELYPYAFNSYVTLLSGMTMLCREIQILNDSGENLPGPTTQMELDAVEYVWSHRYSLCSTYDDIFDHHIDFVSRALRFRALAEG